MSTFKKVLFVNIFFILLTNLFLFLYLNKINYIEKKRYLITYEAYSKVRVLNENYYLAVDKILKQFVFFLSDDPKTFDEYKINTISTRLANVKNPVFSKKHQMFFSIDIYENENIHKIIENIEKHFEFSLKKFNDNMIKTQIIFLLPSYDENQAKELYNKANKKSFLKWQDDFSGFVDGLKLTNSKFMNSAELVLAKNYKLSFVSLNPSRQSIFLSSSIFIIGLINLVYFVFFRNTFFKIR